MVSMSFSSARRRGFTLIELLVVLGIIALLLTLAVPRFFPSIDKSRETILAENLRNTREIIGQYYSDTGRYPDSLEQLVEKKYLRGLPVDPLTESTTTWTVVAPEDGGAPGRPLAFLSEAGQGINFRRGTWHGVLTPLHAPGLFAVVDRIGGGANLEEHWFETPYRLMAP